MKFSITKTENDKLSAITKVIQSVEEFSVKSTQYILKVEDNKLNMFIYENGSIVKYFVNIEDIEIGEKELSYFELDISTLLLATEKIFKLGTDKVNIEVKDAQINNDSEEADKRHLKMFVSSGKNSISNNLVNSSTTADFEEASNALDTKKKEFFSENTSQVLVDAELIKFANTVGKFIPMAGSARVTGIAIEGNKLYYSDQSFSIVDKTLEVPHTAEVDGAYSKKLLPQSLFNLMSNIQNAIKTFNVTYSEDSSLIYIDASAMNLEMVMSLPSVLCEYPTDEELTSFKPDPNSMYKFSINKTEFLQKLNLFDGVFPSTNWKWKTVKFDYDEESGKVILSHSDFNSEVETDLSVKVLEKSTDKELSFKMPSLILYDYLQKIVSDEEITLTVGPESPEEMHGIGFIVDVSDAQIVFSKLLNEELY